MGEPERINYQQIAIGRVRSGARRKEGPGEREGKSRKEESIFSAH